MAILIEGAVLLKLQEKGQIFDSDTRLFIILITVFLVLILFFICMLFSCIRVFFLVK
jgi:hypothetical protein